MKKIFLFVVFSVMLLSLWGCNSSTQSQNHEATIEQAASTNRPFITKWQGTAGKELRIPILGTYTLTWYNEATPEERYTEQVSITSYIGKHEFEETTPYTFTTPTDGVYVVEAGPEGVEGMLMSFDGDVIFSMKLLSVVQFGDVVWKKLRWAFYNCSDMRFEEGIDTPNLSQCTNLSWMFTGCESFNHPLGSWNVSQVTLMTGMFAGCRSFNQPLEKWDVSKVTDMSDMFTDCTAFNQPLAQWDVANVKDMSRMFYGCSSFNQSLEAWNINPLAHSEGMVGMFNDSPAAELPFAAKWRAAGYNIDMYEEMQ
jgi:membrane associated lipoprotein